MQMDRQTDRKTDRQGESCMSRYTWQPCMDTPAYSAEKMSLYTSSREGVTKEAKPIGW